MNTRTTAAARQTASSRRPRPQVARSSAVRSLQQSAGNRAVASLLTHVDAATKGGGVPLPGRVRGEMEKRFGHDFNGVRVHHGSRATASANALAARAYTVGTDIVMGAGGFRPDTPGGHRLLAHELAHVVQQSRGAGPAPSPAAEREADGHRPTPGSVGPSVQRQPKEDGPKLGSGGWMASQKVPLAKSVEKTHWGSAAQRRHFINEYLDYAKDKPELKALYDEALATYGAEDGPAPAPTAPSAAALAWVEKKTQAAPVRRVRTVQFQKFATFWNEAIVTVELPDGAIQTGPHPSAGYNFDTYLVNGHTGKSIPAQHLGGTRYRVFMGTPECPGCHFGQGLQVDLLGENPAMIMIPMVMATAVGVVGRRPIAATGGGAKPPTPSGGGLGPPFTTAELEGAVGGAPKTTGPLARTPVTPSGAPARVLEVSAGPKNTNLSLPTNIAGPPVKPDASLIRLIRSDVNKRPGVAFVDASAQGEALKPVYRGQFDTVLINNPRGYVPDIPKLGEALKPNGRIIVQGKGELFKGMRGTNGDFNKLVKQGAPPGYTMKTETLQPSEVLGGPFNSTTGEPVGLPNMRLIYERAAAP